MKRIILLVVIALIAWQGYDRYTHNKAVRATHVAAESDSALPSVSVPVPVPASAPDRVAESPTSSPFKCDGRTYCSQMTSCAEATYFLKNCPGVTMDGNNDGIPCEKQWCKP